MNNQESILEQETQLQDNPQQEIQTLEQPQPNQAMPIEENQQQQQENQNSSDWTSGIDPIDLVDLAVEVGKGALDIVGSALENIDISF